MDKLRFQNFIYKSPNKLNLKKTWEDMRSVTTPGKRKITEEKFLQCYQSTHKCAHYF